MEKTPDLLTSCKALHLVQGVTHFEVSEPRFEPPAAFFCPAQRRCAALFILALVCSEILRRPLTLRGVSFNGPAAMLFDGRPLRFPDRPNRFSPAPSSDIRLLALSLTALSASNSVCRCSNHFLACVSVVPNNLPTSDAISSRLAALLAMCLLPQYSRYILNLEPDLEQEIRRLGGDAFLRRSLTSFAPRPKFQHDPTASAG